MMDHDYWGMGYGIWFVPVIIILIFVLFFRKRLNK